MPQNPSTLNPPVPGRPDLKGTVWSTAFIGIGLMAAIDEIVFHQMLAWHHFFDKSTPAVGLMSDGFLHATELLSVVGGFFWFSDVRRRHALIPKAAWAGFLIGAGGFQLFDGIINHKVLRLHQIRYGVELLPYDIAWNVSAAAVLAVGIILFRRAAAGTRHHARPPANA